MNTHHTPGPWKVEHGDVWALPYGLLFAVRYLGNSPDLLCERAANARLIAAAPELLEACETALANLAPAYSSDHLVMKRLRAAIAKALQP